MRECVHDNVGAGGPPGPIGSQLPRPRRRGLLAGVVVVVITTAVGLGVTNPLAKSAPAKSGVSDNADPTSLAPVTRQDLTSQTQVSATLGYAGSYTVSATASGITTPASLSLANRPTITVLAAQTAYQNVDQPISGIRIGALSDGHVGPTPGAPESSPATYAAT